MTAIAGVLPPGLDGLVPMLATLRRVDIDDAGRTTYPRADWLSRLVEAGGIGPSVHPLDTPAAAGLRALCARRLDGETLGAADRQRLRRSLARLEPVYVDVSRAAAVVSDTGGPTYSMNATRMAGGTLVLTDPAEGYPAAGVRTDAAGSSRVAPVPLIDARRKAISAAEPFGLHPHRDRP